MKRRDYIFCFLNEIKSHASEVISFWDHSGSIYNWVFLSWGLYVGLVRTISVSGNEVCVCMVVVVIVVGGDFFHYYYFEFVYCSVHLIMCVKSQRLPSCFPICPLTCNIVPSPLFFFHPSYEWWSECRFYNFHFSHVCFRLCTFNLFSLLFVCLWRKFVTISLIIIVFFF